MLHKICCDLHGWLTYAFFSDRSRSRCPCFTQLRKRSLWTLQARLRERGPSQSKKEEICEGCGSGSMHSAHALAQEAFREGRGREW